MNNYRILSLQISNARTIEMVDITPQSDLIKIQGENGQGKSTVLDMITAAFTRTGLDDGIVKKGEDSAMVVANIGEYVVKRTIRRDKTPAIEIRRVDTGKKIDRPADEFIAEITGKNGKRPIALDISRIVEMDGAERLALLMECAGIDTAELERLNGKHKELAETRKAEKKNLDRAQTEMDALQQYAAPVKEPPDAATLMKRQKEIAEKRAKWKAKSDEAVRLGEDANALAIEIDELNKKLREKMVEKEEKESRVKALLDEIRNGDDADLAKQEEKLAKDAEDASKNRSAYDNHKKYIDKKAEWQKQYHVMNKAEKDLEAVVEEKKKLLDSGKYPTPNLTVQEGEIYFKGTHWSQLSESERLKVALAIANGLNPPLRVILVRDGNAFDENALRQISSWAKSNDFQIWMERVSSVPVLGSDAVYIVEGTTLTEEQKEAVIKEKMTTIN